MSTIETKWIQVTIPAWVTKPKATVDPVGVETIIKAGIGTSNVATTISKAWNVLPVYPCATGELIPLVAIYYRFISNFFPDRFT